MAETINWPTIEQKMKKSVEVLQRELAPIRTGHATPALVENVRVDYAGVPTPLNHLAAISAPGARLLVIQPWERSILPTIEKAILKSDLGLHPSNDGNVIRLTIPPLSEERRQELTKAVHARVEQGRIAIRNIRRDSMDDFKALEKNKEISQDELKRSLDRLQKLTDHYIIEVDKAGQAKETELKEV